MAWEGSNFGIPHDRADLPEARKLLGIKDCPDCVTSAGGLLRKDVDHADIIAEATYIWSQSTKTAAREKLDTADLADAHLFAACPYTGLFANCTSYCLPGDRLHLLCVPVHVRAFLAVQMSPTWGCSYKVSLCPYKGSLIARSAVHGNVATYADSLHFIRESGVLATLASFVREDVGRRPHGGGMLTELSQRYSTAAMQLGIRHVPSFFEHKHGRLTALHHRTMAEVLQVITCDLIPPASALGKVIAATTRWYWACRAKEYTQADVVELKRLGAAMQTAWVAYDIPELRETFRQEAGTPKSDAVDLPKFHRSVAHLPTYIPDWGPYEYLTTETSESMHKPFKMIFKRFACFSSCAQNMPCSGVCMLCMFPVTGSLAVSCLHGVCVLIRMCAAPTSEMQAPSSRIG